MKVETIWGCECQRYFVPTEKLNAKVIELRCQWKFGRCICVVVSLFQG